MKFAEYDPGFQHLLFTSESDAVCQSILSDPKEFIMVLLSTLELFHLVSTAMNLPENQQSMGNDLDWKRIKVEWFGLYREIAQTMQLLTLPRPTSHEEKVRLAKAYTMLLARYDTLFENDLVLQELTSVSVGDYLACD